MQATVAHGYHPPIRSGTPDQVCIRLFIHPRLRSFVSISLMQEIKVFTDRLDCRSSAVVVTNSSQYGDKD